MAVINLASSISESKVVLSGVTISIDFSFLMNFFVCYTFLIILVGIVTGSMSMFMWVSIKNKTPKNLICRNNENVNRSIRLMNIQPESDIEV